MKRFFVLATVVVLTISAPAQHHALSEGQCNADARAWSDEDNVKHQTAKELKLRMEELFSCKDSYPENEQVYFAPLMFSIARVADLQQRFIERHGLGKQFDEEDEKNH